VQVLGTLIETVIAMEDRQLFAAAMEQIDEKCMHSASATMTDEVIATAEIGLSCTLSGLGSGFAQNKAQ
jgi:carbamoyl-phosphate synthase/aspartate carbamoyltransferase